MLADTERVETALRVWTRIRKTEALHRERAARDPRWDEWMSPPERHQLLAMSVFDHLAFLAVVDAETHLIESLGEICDESDVRAALEQHRPKRREP